MRLAVLGVGLIGGSIGLAARRRLGAEVAGFDRDPGTLERARERGAIDRAAASAEDACTDAELVFCAAPVGALPELVGAALAAAPQATVVTDVGSTKRGVVAAAGSDERFIGGHPLAGAETAGVAHARPDLFEGARWYLTPGERASGVLYDRLQRVVAELGARPQAIDAAAHDRLMAAVSHLPHVVANVLATEAGSALAGEEGLPEAGPSLRDATRVAGANPGVWADIFTSNSGPLADAVESAAERLREAARLIRGGDAAATAAWHAAAGEARRRLVGAEAAGGPVAELRVMVPNRPGIVAEVALALGRGGVNIEDMALHPTADMSSGAISLWVAGPAEADRAAALLRELGHSVSVDSGGG